MTPGFKESLLKTMIIGVALCAITLSPARAAAQGNLDGTKYDKGSIVTIQGCVVRGENPDTYVFTGVKEWPIGVSPMGIYGPRHYWFDIGAHDFGSFVGQMVQLKGPITELKESEVEREPGGWHGGRSVAVELPGRDVHTTPGNAGVGAADRWDRTDMKVTLLKLEVEELIVVMKTCLAFD